MFLGNFFLNSVTAAAPREFAISSNFSIHFHNPADYRTLHLALSLFYLFYLAQHLNFSTRIKIK